MTAKKPSEQKLIEEMAHHAGITINGKGPFDIQVKDPKFYRRLLSGGSLALGESYMDGWWESDSIDEMINQLLRADLKDKLRPTFTLAFNFCKAFLLNMQSKKRSHKVVDDHYNLGNDLYEVMLDPTMAYSCGYWKRAKTLQEAQEDKFEIIAQKLGLKPGMRVLDIGCGWGGALKYMAEKYQIEGVGVTISENQASFGKELCKGLPIQIKLQDYRDLKGQFDRIYSIGMFEHVGPDNHLTYMKKAHSLLKDEGLFCLHTIGGNKECNTGDPWIHKYIFPGGVLPAPTQITKAIRGLFTLEDWHNFGTDYDKTLMEWYKRFDAGYDQLKERYPERFYRMWKFYLLCCAGVFRSRQAQLWQVVLSKGRLSNRDSFNFRPYLS
ncbi:MAG: Cyclopropane-fatty-acyl-phospholipid synthase [Chlamydiia bacterium]|nr:Cyclopropane-fatty-acyl-phospholipid synthase [Chlamydiia bacterium]